MAIEKPEPTNAYSFFEQKMTGEVHIFEGEFTPEGCIAKSASICEKVTKSDKESQQLSVCLDEDEARLEAASNGRVVCGTCVSHLYATYE